MVTQRDVDSALAQQFTYPTLVRGGVADEVVAAYEPQVPEIEPLRMLRSQLALRWLTTTNRRMLAITSPQRGDGRSWLAANLATVFAQGGESTLLIDTDMRHPCQHRMFNLDNDAGLSALLTGRAEGGDAVQRVHPQLNLFVLPAGNTPPNPQELLLRPMFEISLNRFAQLFSIIVLDTPAATESSDSQIVAARAGSAVLLSRRNRTRVSGLVETMQNLSETGVAVVGSVINEH